MKMHRLVLAAAISLGMAGGVGLVAMAQDAHSHQPPSPDKTVARLSKKLNLTDDQKAKITPIIADRQQKMEALQADTSKSREDKRDAMKSIMEDSNGKIKDVLTDDQKKSFDQMQQDMREHMRDRRNGGAGDTTQQ